MQHELCTIGSSDPPAAAGATAVRLRRKKLFQLLEATPLDLYRDRCVCVRVSARARADAADLCIGRIREHDFYRAGLLAQCAAASLPATARAPTNLARHRRGRECERARARTCVRAAVRSPPLGSPDPVRAAAYRRWNLDRDELLKARWAATGVMKESIDNFLDAIGDTEWVLGQLVSAVGKRAADTRALLKCAARHIAPGLAIDGISGSTNSSIEGTRWRTRRRSRTRARRTRPTTRRWTWRSSTWGCA